MKKVNSLTLSSGRTGLLLLHHVTALFSHSASTNADILGAGCSIEVDHGTENKQFNFIKHQDCYSYSTYILTPSVMILVIIIHNSHHNHSFNHDSSVIITLFQGSIAEVLV